MATVASALLTLITLWLPWATQTDEDGRTTDHVTALNLYSDTCGKGCSDHVLNLWGVLIAAVCVLAALLAVLWLIVEQHALLTAVVWLGVTALALVVLDAVIVLSDAHQHESHAPLSYNYSHHISAGPFVTFFAALALLVTASRARHS
ncbi:hypothetical protein [Streptomyces orinoci]|uniref:Uncharacterized protein n=1 Tax=Streptomyces orinoci TaxID=67339 RepID=A0ABV3K1I3_STRON|nr:hypothetical protein [Streptomyces orinoci]